MNRRWERLRIGAAGCTALMASVLILVFAGQQASHQSTETGDARPSQDVASTTPPTPTPTPTPKPTSDLSSSTAAPTSRSAGVLRRLLASVAVVPRRPNIDGYDRSCSPGAGCVFGPAWTDDTASRLGHNGCDTRNDVLRKALTDITIDPGTHGCVVRSGRLDDPYTGGTIAFLRGEGTSRQVEIDHLIPLAAAWDMGAWKWSPHRRVDFANDVDHELLAVDGPANQQKSDSTPASWLPPNKAFRCDYAVRYLRASLVWNLPITAADAEVLGSLARSCH